jgi:hypothetical protein
MTTHARWSSPNLPPDATGMGRDQLRMARHVAMIHSPPYGGLGDERVFLLPCRIGGPMRIHERILLVILISAVLFAVAFVAYTAYPLFGR